MLKPCAIDWVECLLLKLKTPAPPSFFSGVTTPIPVSNHSFDSTYLLWPQWPTGACLEVRPSNRWIWPLELQFSPAWPSISAHAAQCSHWRACSWLSQALKTRRACPDSASSLEWNYWNYSTIFFFLLVKIEMILPIAQSPEELLDKTRVDWRYKVSVWSLSLLTKGREKGMRRNLLG